MPNIYKVQHETSTGDVILYATAADIVAFDSSNTTGLAADNVQSAICAVNEKAEGKANMLTLTTTIIASAFEGMTAPYTQRIELADIKETDAPDIGVLMSGEDVTLALNQKEAFGSISMVQTGDGFIVVSCFEDKPRVDVPIQIRILR